MPYPCISIYQARVELLLSCFVESPGRRFHLESKQRQRSLGWDDWLRGRQTDPWPHTIAINSVGKC